MTKPTLTKRPSDRKAVESQPTLKGRSKYLADVHKVVHRSGLMSSITKECYGNITRRLGPNNLTAMEALSYFVLGYRRDIIEKVIHGVEDSFAEVIIRSIVGEGKGQGFAAKGYWSEIDGLLMSVWGYPVVLNHERVAAKIERLEGHDLAAEYRSRIAWLQKKLGEQPSPKVIRWWLNDETP